MQTLHTSIERQFGSVQLNLLCVYLVGKLTLKTMLVCVWLVSSLIHMISGCSLFAPTEVTGYTGGSVVLPCYCTEGQPTPNTARWHFIPHGIWVWLYPNTVDNRYTDRVNISATPGNLSLHFSDLTLSDAGTYTCEAAGQRREIILTVKGCSLSGPTEVTGYTGGSVVLFCYCTERQPTLNSARWGFCISDVSSYIELWSYPNNVDGRYKDRVFISATPGKLSLHLSNLTLSDTGTYSCEVAGERRDIFLTMEGCVLSGSKPIDITGFTGDSVVLPCACTNVQKKPEWIRWTVHPEGQRTVIFSQRPRSVNDHYKRRVQVLDSVPLGNLSVRLSDLTLSDGGTYRCEADGQHRDISLTVKGCVLSDSEPIHITGFTGDSVVLPCACSDVQRKPEWVKWTAYTRGRSTDIFLQRPANVSRYKERVEVLDSISPGNLSLRLSDLTLSDGGAYWCEADGHNRYISLTVIHRFDKLCLTV